MIKLKVDGSTVKLPRVAKTPRVKCTCGRNWASKKGHPCPYKVDVNDDPDTLCHCCTDCRRECADDI